MFLTGQKELRFLNNVGSKNGLIIKIVQVAALDTVHMTLFDCYIAPHKVTYVKYSLKLIKCKKV